MYRILIVEDEPQMQAGLRDNLEFEGYEVEIAGDGESGLEMIVAGNYHLVLLDVMLPKMSGMDVCRQVREKGLKIPIIMLTAKGEEIDKVLGLELGADDYVAKPFSLRELLARIKAVLRRNPDGAAIRGEKVEFGRLSVDFSTYTATENGQPVEMTHREFEILKFLWQHRNEVVSRDQILTEVWGYDAAPTTRTVDNFILKLRQKIEEEAAQPRHIVTVHGIGYKLLV